MNTKPKILITDDSVMNQEILTEILGAQYEYLYASNGVQAIEILEQMSVDLMLLDINMPELDGFGVLDIMNRRHWIEDIPVMIISAEDDTGYIQRGYDLGVTDYINRPFNFMIVQRRVNNTLMLYARQKRLVHLVQSQVLEREKANSTMVNILSYVIESRNNETGIHLLHVRTLTELLLRELPHQTDRYPLSESDISMITTISALHDIGKINVPVEILNKPGRLTAEEFEIMKRHTITADELLREVPSAQGDPMMRWAHEICRWHHERWDGRGYPDGLRGDEIPISAQVVALADVYDALTSERCYKKAFSHETAIRMILSGECGAFNPILLRCLTAVAGQLVAAMHQSPEEFDYQSEARRLTAEMLEQEDLPYSDHAVGLLAIEAAKKDFFARQCGGIQFDYNRWLHKAVYTDWTNPQGARWQTLDLSNGEGIELLAPEELQRLTDAVAACTRQVPEGSLEVRAVINGSVRRLLARFQSLWTADGTDWVSLVGQFSPAQPEASLCDLPISASRAMHLRAAMDELTGVFDLVRIVNPDTCRVLTLGENGELLDSGKCCYSTWGTGHRCANCTSFQAKNSKSWSTKLEFLNTTPYFVLSRYEQIDGNWCVLELVSMLNMDLTDTQSSCSRQLGSNMMTFYRDSLTHAYTRLYLDNFLPNLEHADGVALIDVDKFKQINDACGHTVGDEALRIIADTILSCIRSSDTLIRYGGDEFLLIFSKIAEPAFRSRLKQICRAVSEKTVPEHPEIQLGISLGGAYQVYPLAEAIRCADAKMYEQKAAKASLTEPMPQ